MLLVKEGLSSKLIARELGISHRTVDQHIAAALETLGMPTRLAAISELYRLEAQGQAEATQSPFMLRDEQRQLGELSLIEDPAHSRSRPILPPLGGATNAASRSQRIVWMARVAILCIMVTSATVLAVLAVSRMANGYGG